MKRGFTLIELMAVIVVLGILATISIISVDKIIKENKEETYKAQIATIEDAARTWGVKHIKELPDNDGGAISVPLLYFKNDGIISEDFKNPKTNKPFNNDLYVNISYEGGIYKYEIAEGSGLGADTNPKLLNKKYGVLEVLCKAVTSSIAGNVPQGNYANGDEYVCQVSDTQSYNFYILDSDEKKVNMIMDRNLCEDGTAATSTNKCVVSWISKEDYVAAGGEGSDYDKFLHNNKGPLTALKYLANATSSWNKLSSLNELYTDEGGVYGTILLNGKARLPKKSELKTYSTSTRYLFNNLAKYSEVTGVDNISNIEGYWALPTIIGYTQPSRAIAVQAKYSSSLGYPDNNIVSYSTYGVRPVITIAKSQLQ